MPVDIQKISIQKLEPNVFEKTYEKIKFFIHEHSTMIKVGMFIGLIVSLGLLIAMPYIAPALGTFMLVNMIISNVLSVLINSVALLTLDYFVPPHHDMKNHVYKAQECEGGKLYYEGDVPILSLESDDPYKAGKAHGYLCGDAINRLSKRFAVMTTFPFLVQKTLAEIKKTIPENYMKEMEGVIEGYAKWAKENKWQLPKKLTLDDLILFHMIPDSQHLDMREFEKSFSEEKGFQPRNANQTPVANPVQPVRIQETEAANHEVVACSVIMDKEKERGMVVARNMDWPSLGLSGTYSLVIHRKHSNALLDTVEVGIPSFVGTMTGMNNKGLTLGMNVCPGKTNTVNGMPALFFNRRCLEQCATVAQAEEFAKNHAPLGAYHMNIADKNAGKAFHFYQSPTGEHVVREWKENQPLVSLNSRYSPEQGPARDQRKDVLEEFFCNRNERPIEATLSLPQVNNWWTTHHIVMEPKSKTFKVAFDNALAGRIPLHTVPTDKLFGHR